eukprot:14311553-Ditylum_brightwellii.AAC.2
MEAVAVEEIRVVEGIMEDDVAAVEVAIRGKHANPKTQRLVTIAQAGMDEPTGDATTYTPTSDKNSKGALPGGHTTVLLVNTANDTATLYSAFNLQNTGCWAGGI